MQTAKALTLAAQALERGGADYVCICTNTMHKVAPQVAAGIGIPLLHIADATARVLQRDAVAKVGLLGTAYTMEQDFYKGRLAEHFGLQVLVPDAADRAIVHAVIYDELCLGTVNAHSRREFQRIIARLQERGAEAVILGCTEIGLLISAADSCLPVYDTTQLHAAEAVRLAVE